MKRNQRGVGIVLSYAVIVLNTCINLVLTPLMIAVLTDDAYGVYRIMRSLAGPLVILNFGVSTVVTRSIVRYRESVQESTQQKENTLAIAMRISLVMATAIMAVACVIMTTIPRIYGATILQEHIRSAQKVFLIFAGATAMNVLTETYRGCVIGHERFVFYHGSHVAQQIIRFLAIFLLLKSDCGIIAIAMVDLLIAATILLAFGVYAHFVLGERMKLYHADRESMKEFATFAAAILLQAVVNQVNNNVDIIIMGAMVPAKEIITMYSCGLTIYAVYNSLISAFSGVFLPQAMKLVAHNASGKELTDFVIRPGRIQAILAVAVVGGFASAGREFIHVWVGEQYSNAYYVALFLMIPVTIPLVENVCICILDANLKRIFRSVTLVAMACLNVLLTVVLIPLMGFWGALLATVISISVGHVFLMNWYYHKALKIEVMRMFREIFSRTLGIGLLATGITLLLPVFHWSDLVSLVFKCIAFVLIYGLMINCCGLNQEEKQQVNGMLGKVSHRLKNER